MVQKGQNTEVDVNELVEEIEENVLPPDNIVVLNELRSASDLNLLMSTDDSIDLHPDFQRDEVWNDEARARFIDSLSKEFPIPSMCFALDPKEQKYIVIDGLQRMSTIKRFLNDPAWVLPKLKDIDQKISGRSVSDIKKQAPGTYRRIENISLPVTILRYDPGRSDNMDYIFTIFQRLNTFGERLNNQEIRNAIYQGPFSAFLRSCAKNRVWVEIARTQKRGRGSRMIAEERALRFFAFYYDANKYNGKLNKFINDYMQKNRYSSDNSNREMIFNSVATVVKRLGVSNLGKSNALKDAVLYGIAKNLGTLENVPVTRLSKLLENLKENKHFTVQALSEATMQKDKVHDRLTTAATIFSRRT